MSSNIFNDPIYETLASLVKKKENDYDGWLVALSITG